MTETNEPGAGRVWFRGRVVVILLGLLVVICGAVLVTDKVSPRDRRVGPATTGATTSSATKQLISK